MGGESLPGPTGGNTGPNTHGNPGPNPKGGFAFPGPAGTEAPAEKLDKSTAPSAVIAAPPLTIVGKAKVNGIDVVTLADGTDAKIIGAHTSFHLGAGEVPGYKWSGPKKIITELTGPMPIITATIQTFYNPNAKATDLSAYGRGTTSEDKRNGNATLGFHESCHRTDYVAYIAANPLPIFSGKAGMTEDEYKAATKSYLAAIKNYHAKCLKASEDKTDEVGSPKKSQYKARNKH